MPVGLGLGIAGVASAGASLIGGSEARNDQNEAAQAAESMQGPYVNAGKTAIGQIDNPNTLAANYVQSPGYQFNLAQGENAVNTNSAMNGLLRSGGAVKGLDAYAGGMADQDFNNWFGQNLSLAQLGSSAASNVSNIMTGQGRNNANADIANANSAASGIGSLSNLIPGLQQMAAAQTGGGSTSYSTGQDSNGQVAPFLYGA